MKEIFERQAVILRLTHTEGITGDEIIPTTVTWSLHDALSGTAIKTDQIISSITGNVVDIEIASVDNRILSNTNYEEVKVATIRSAFAGGSLATQEYSYKVKNMGYWSPAAP